MALLQMTREEYEQKYGVVPATPIASSATEYKTGGKGLLGVLESVGQKGREVGKGLVKSVVGKLLARPGEAIAKATVGRFIPETIEQEASRTQVTRALTAPAETGFEKAGEIAGDIGSLAIRGGAVARATKGLSVIPRIATRAATSGGIVTAQEGEIGAGTGVATGAEVAFPIAGAVLRPIGRLVKSLASGLSGVSSKAIESIVSEPNVAKQVAKEIDMGSITPVIKKNAETIINGVSKVRQDARKAYGEAIGALKATDIDAKTFRSNLQPTLEKYGSVVKNGE